MTNTDFLKIIENSNKNGRIYIAAFMENILGNPKHYLLRDSKILVAYHFDNNVFAYIFKHKFPFIYVLGSKKYYYIYDKFDIDPPISHTILLDTIVSESYGYKFKQIRQEQEIFKLI